MFMYTLLSRGIVYRTCAFCTVERLVADADEIKRCRGRWQCLEFASEGVRSYLKQLPVTCA